MNAPQLSPLIFVPEHQRRPGKRPPARDLPRMYPLNEARPEGADEFEPVAHQKCIYWRWKQDRITGVRFKQTCGRCLGCRNYRYERLVGQGIAESQYAGVVMAVTLTYANLPNGETPQAAKRLKYKDVELFLMRLRKAGYKFTKIAAGEYGGEKGRAHWHLMLFFPWKNAVKQRITDAIANNHDHSRITGEAVDHPVYQYGLRGPAFTDAIANPEVLVVSRAAAIKPPDPIRNTNWKFWPHGIVEAQLVKAPDFISPEAIEVSTRYNLKYLVKDAWRDSRKYSSTPFHELRQHIQEQTRFGPWLTPDEIKEQFEKDRESGAVAPTSLSSGALNVDIRKWRLGNPVAQQKIEAVEALTGMKYRLTDWDKVPIEMAVMRGEYHYKCKNGLGHEFFKALGARSARSGFYEGDGIFYEVGNNFMTKDRSSYAQARRNVGSRHKPMEETAILGHQKAVKIGGRIVMKDRKRFKFPMGKTQQRHFWSGYNLERGLSGLPETLGPDGVLERLENDRFNASNSASKNFLYVKWKNAKPSVRYNMELHAASISDKALNWAYPKWWVEQQYETNQHPDWLIKAADRTRVQVEAQLEKGYVHTQTGIAHQQQLFRIASALNGETFFRLDKLQKAWLWSELRRLRKPFRDMQKKGLSTAEFELLATKERIAAKVGVAINPVINREGWDGPEFMRPLPPFMRKDPPAKQVQVGRKSVTRIEQKHIAKPSVDLGQRLKQQRKR